jgi:hypothetical protein
MTFVVWNLNSIGYPMVFDYNHVCHGCTSCLQTLYSSHWLLSIFSVNLICNNNLCHSWNGNDSLSNYVCNDAPFCSLNVILSCMSYPIQCHVSLLLLSDNHPKLHCQAFGIVEWCWDCMLESFHLPLKILLAPWQCNYHRHFHEYHDYNIYMSSHLLAQDHWKMPCLIHST